MAVDVSERSRAIVVAEDVARCLEVADTLEARLTDAARVMHHFAREGSDAAAVRIWAPRVLALKRLLTRHFAEELREVLMELDRVYGVSEEVKW